MALSISTGDLKRLNALQDALLSPFEHPSVDDWCLNVLRCADALYQSDRSLLLLPLDDAIHHVSENVDLRYRSAFLSGIVGVELGAFRYADQMTEEAHVERRRKRLEVWTIPMVVRLQGIAMDAFPVYHEVVKPAGLTCGPVMTVALPIGEAHLGAAHSHPEESRFDDQAELSMAALVLPAFKAAVRTLASLNTHREVLISNFDALGEALAIFDASGQIWHETSHVETLLESEPESALVREHLREFARSLARFRYGRLPSPAQALGHPEIRTQHARYTLSGSFFGRGVLGFDDAILIRIERRTPMLPSPAHLVTRYNLTRRQAQIALLLAQGLSNVAIADRISVSRHTVRHHAEWVFLKLGVHTRKALALLLLNESPGPISVG